MSPPPAPDGILSGLVDGPGRPKMSSVANRRLDEPLSTIRAVVPLDPDPTQYHLQDIGIVRSVRIEPKEMVGQHSSLGASVVEVALETDRG